jgi:hypothetical protein
MLHLGGRTIGQLCELLRFVKECKQAALKFLLPKMRSDSLPIISLLGKLEQAIGEDGSTTYLKPINIKNETPEKLVSESKESLLARTVDKEKTARQAGIKAENIYGRYVRMKNDGNLCDLELGGS